MHNQGRKPSSSNRHKSKSSFLGTWFKRLILFLGVFAIIGLGGYVAYQDYTVRQQFEGKRWALPARVYASPIELFAGDEIDSDRLQAILEQLKYRNDPSLSSQATYARRGNEILLKTREFQFWDKLEPARHVRIRFADSRVQSIDDVADNQSVPIMRLEPVQIGSFYPALKEDRILVKLDQVPKSLLNALFAVEDRDFYQHFGVSPKGILRALWANVRAGGIVQGGSTLTQQLVKNFYLSSERTWWRKLNEVVMALLLEARYSKDEILEAYLNEIYLGQDGARAVHGFGLASQYYFSRNLDELELHHVALLAALVRGPSFYDPNKSPAKARARRNLVLDEMAALEYIAPAQAEAAKSKPLDVLKNPHQAISRYPAFLDLVRRQLQQEYRNEDLTSEGLRIFTTLDVEAQEQLEASIAATLKRLDRQTKTTELQTAAIITRRATGEISALAGSRDAESSGFNRALDAERQIGSLYKPVVYLTALADPQAYTIITPLQDTALRLSNPGGGAWSPKNYDNREHGLVPLHTALANSFNLATVRLGMSVGVAHTVKTLRNLGVERPLEVFPATLLGTSTLTPMEVAQMYQTLASDGFVTPLRAIQSVVSQDGKPLQRYALSVKQSVDPAAVYLVNTVLQEAVREGTGRSVYSYLPPTYGVAGKTGTTNDLRDSWFAAFTGDYVGVVWVGRDDNQSARLTGAQGALQIWASTMGKVAKEPLELQPPENVEMVWIDRENGLRASEACGTAMQYPFIMGSAPAEFSACSQTPLDAVEKAGSWLKGLF
jgi:penicillin-binding protein 1B